MYYLFLIELKLKLYYILGITIIELKRFFMNSMLDENNFYYSSWILMEFMLFSLVEYITDYYS